MPEPNEPSAERLDTIEQKLDALSVSVDRRFDEVTQQFVEQREYTGFAFRRLEQQMIARFERVDARFDRVDARFDRVDERFDRIDARFDRLERKVDRIDHLERKVDRIEHLERKLDRILEGQIRSRRGTRRLNRGKKR